MDNEWLKTAIRLAKLGKKQEAQEILHGLVKRAPTDYQAWLWLADTMNTQEERISILREALVHNPDNGVIRRSLGNLGVKSPPPIAPAAKPTAAKPGGFSISMDELQSLDQRIDHDEESAPEVDWLRALGESKPVSPDLAVTGKAEPAPGSIPASQDAHRPELQTQKSAEGNHAADFLNLIHRQDTDVPAEPVVDAPAKPPRSQDGKAERPAAVKNVEPDDGSLAIDNLDYQIEDHSTRRRWLGIIFVLVLLAVLAAAIYLAWPTIWGTISPLIAAISQPVVVEPTSTPTATLSPTPSLTPTITYTPTATRTPEPTPLPTDTPIPLLLNPGLVEPKNIQQFKSLGLVEAHGAVSFSARLLAETVEEKSVQIWDFMKNGPRIELTGPTQRIQQSAFSPDGKRVAAVSEDPAVWVWDIETGEVFAKLEFSLELSLRYVQDDFPKTLQIQFSPDGKAVFVSSMMGVTWWDLTTRLERHLFPLLPKEYEDFRKYALDSDGATATSFLLSFSPDGKAYAVGSQTKVYILTWPGAGGRATLNTGKPLIAMQWMDNGLLGLTHPGQVSVWNTYFNKLVQTFPGLKSQPADQPPAAAFQRDGQRMAIEVDSTRNVPGGMMLVELPGGEKGATFDPLSFTRVSNPMFSLDGSILFGSSGGDLFVWETATGKVLRRIANRKGFSELSADGRFYLEVSTIGTSIWGIP